VRRHVFSIPPGVPFLETFVKALLNGDITPSISDASGPLELARATIYVPTQRAGRALASEFGRAIKTPSALLPRILPLGGLDEQETGTLFDSSSQVDDVDDALAPAIDDIDRRLILTQLVMEWARALRHAVVSVDRSGTPEFDRSEKFVVASSPASAYALAGELGALIDEFIIENVDWSRIDHLSDDSFDKFWAITTQFLKIALHQWPNVLAERGLVDRAARQASLIDAQVARLAASAGNAPVIALGSTGANAATARLLAAIARMEHGAVILPGLDRDLDEETWRLIGETEPRLEPSFTHPQVILKRLLSTLDARRSDVKTIGEASTEVRLREALAAEALRPADATENWRAYRTAHAVEFEAALRGVSFIEAADERDEALALALFMRETLETPERTAALITPDRDIARRVAAELARYDIEIDDSGGKPLGLTAVGGLARLLAASAHKEFSAVEVAALLAHPMARFGLDRQRIAELAPLAEIAVLRVVGRNASGWAPAVETARELAKAAHSYPAVQRMSEVEWDAIENLFLRIDAAMKPLVSLPQKAPLEARVSAHRECLEAVVAGGDDDRSDATEGVGELLSLFDRLLSAQAAAALQFDAGSYAAFFDRLVNETVVHGLRRAHPRLKILGPLEARLLSADLVLLAGFDEGVWPPQADAGSFLNRSMRRQLGLSPPERRIGQSTHDFAMAFGAQKVVLSRARKRRGTPTVVSRVIARLAALSGVAFDACKQRGDAMLKIAAALDHPKEIRSVERPLPRPPLELRPLRLSVTRIETLRRDPYAVYAERVLNLIPLAPLGYQKGAREIGTAIHAALAQCICDYPKRELPFDARERLLLLAKAELDGFLQDPTFKTFDWPRIEAGLDHALAFERERRTEAREIFVETRGAWTLPLSDGTKFVLSAIADRIEIDESGRASVFDYKTGKPPTNKQVEAGLAPQLTLEAAMMEAGAFERMGKHDVAGAAYIHIGGASDGAPQWLEWKDKTFSDVVSDHRAQLLGLLEQFRDVQTPYPSRPFVEFASRFGDYDHLARVKEWSRGGGDDE
jgi:ATP-dependent helicase/nuclease subunit B